jgi:hypothetical protein
MKGIMLNLGKPSDLTKFIADLSKTIDMNTTYTGSSELSYALLEKPDGMTIEPDMGLISWTAPESAEGNSYNVKVKVTDGVLSSEVSFSVVVAVTTPLQTQIDGNVVTVVEQGSNLNGLTITVLDTNINPKDIKLDKLPEDSVQTVPNYVTRITDFFVIKKPISENIKVKLPLSQLPIGADLNYVNLYGLTTADGIEGEFWSPGSTHTNISNLPGEPIVEISLPRLEGVFFIGIEDSNIVSNLRQKRSSKISAKAEIPDVTCTPVSNNDGSLNYMLQN